MLPFYIIICQQQAIIGYRHVVISLWHYSINLDASHHTRVHLFLFDNRRLSSLY